MPTAYPRPPTGFETDTIAALDERLKHRGRQTTLTLRQHMARLNGTSRPLTREEALKLGYGPAEVEDFFVNQHGSAAAVQGPQVLRRNGSTLLLIDANTTLVLPFDADTDAVTAALIGYQFGVDQTAHALERSIDVALANCSPPSSGDL
jgi:hypothetical protein